MSFKKKVIDSQAAIPINFNVEAPPKYSVQDFQRSDYTQGQYPYQKFIKPQRPVKPEGPFQVQALPLSAVDVSQCSDSTFVTCPHCQHTAMSKIEKKLSCFKITVLVISILIPFLLILGSMLIKESTVSKKLSDTYHYCPQCNYLLGVKQGMFC